MSPRDVFDILKKFGMGGTSISEERRARIVYALDLCEITNVVNEAIKRQAAGCSEEPQQIQESEFVGARAAETEAKDYAPF